MSDSIRLAPPPERTGSMRVGDLDTRARSFMPDLGPLGDTILSANQVTVSISRRDGMPTGPADLQLAGPVMLDSTSLIPAFWLDATNAVAGDDYTITVQVITTQGRVLTRDMLLLVTAPLG